MDSSKVVFFRVFLKNTSISLIRKRPIIMIAANPIANCNKSAAQIQNCIFFFTVSYKLTFYQSGTSVAHHKKM